MRPQSLRRSGRTAFWSIETLKVGLVDWGLSDVLLAAGPLGGILRDGMRQLMAKSAAFDPNAAAAMPKRRRRERKIRLEGAT